MADSISVSFTMSNRGKFLLFDSRYVYRLKRSTKNVKYRTCNTDSLLANVHANKFIKTNGCHYHMPASEKSELRNLKKRIKERVQSETNSASQIYVEELACSNLSSVASTLAHVAVESSKLLI